MPFTLLFDDWDEFLEHYDSHVLQMAEFGPLDPASYLRLADEFVGGSRGPVTHECHRSGGDRIRYNPRTEEFGILRADGVIRTYFRPTPDYHGFPTNYAYYRHECLKH